MIISLIKKIKLKLSNSQINYRFARGAFWSLSGAFISRGMQLLSFIVIARLLGKVAFGQLSIIQSSLSVFSTVAGFGLGLAATKFIAEFKVTNKTKAARIRALTSSFAWITSGIVSLIVFFFAKEISERFILNGELEYLIKISALFLLFTSVNGAQNGILAGFEAFNKIAKINLYTGVFNAVVSIGLTYFYGLDGAVWGMAISATILWSVTHIVVRIECKKNEIDYSYQDFWKEKDILIKFSIPAVLSSLITSITMWYVNTLLVKQANGFGELGVYSAIYRIKQMPEMLLGTVMTPLLPMLSDLIGKTDRPKYAETLKMSFNVSMLLLIPISLIQISFPHLTFLLFGKDYQYNPGLVQWLMLHSVLVGLFYPMGTVLSSLNKMWYAWTYNFIWSLLFVGLSIYLIPIGNSKGMAASMAITHLVTSLGVVVIVKKIQSDIFKFIPFNKYLMIVALLLLASFTIFLITS